MDEVDEMEDDEAIDEVDGVSEVGIVNEVVGMDEGAGDGEVEESGMNGEGVVEVDGGIEKLGEGDAAGLCFLCLWTGPLLMAALTESVSKTALSKEKADAQICLSVERICRKS